ncbi:hypothetical protein [Vibrio phage P23]|nr:hypothetical protein [Vibrio phage P23]
MTISKALLPTNLCAIDFKSTLDSWGVNARMVINASGAPSKYVVFDGGELSPGQIKNLDATFGPLYVKIELTDIKFIEELEN